MPSTRKTIFDSDFRGSICTRLYTSAPSRLNIRSKKLLESASNTGPIWISNRLPEFVTRMETKKAGPQTRERVNGQIDTSPAATFASEPYGADCLRFPGQRNLNANFRFPPTPSRLWPSPSKMPANPLDGIPSHHKTCTAVACVQSVLVVPAHLTIFAPLTILYKSQQLAGSRPVLWLSAETVRRIQPGFPGAA